MPPTTRSVLFGLAAGSLTVGTYLAVYYMNKDLFFSPWLTYGTYLFYLAAMYWVVVRAKEEVEGPFPWKEALRLAFLTFLIVNACYYLFYYFIHRSDPALAEMQRELMREALPRLYAPSDLPKAYKDLESGDFSVTPGRALLGWAQGAIVGFGFSALIAMLTKRDV